MANIKIRTRHSTVTRLVRPSPSKDGGFDAFVSKADGFGAYIHRDVLEFIARHARSAGNYEAIGLLAGRICHDPKSGPYTLVMAADGASEGEFKSTPSYVELLAPGHEKVRRRLEQAHPDREIVGWYHTHPHYPPRFSSVDTDEQATWNDPSHIGIVYSGIDAAEPFGVYRGPSAILLRRLDAEPRAIKSPEGQSPTQEVPFREPALLARNIGPARVSRQKKLELTLLCAIALLFVCLLGGFSWLHRRMSSVEARIAELVTADTEDRRRNQSPEQRQQASEEQPSPLATPSPGASSSADNTAPVVGPELRPPAKPLVPDATLRPHARERRETDSRHDVPEREPGKKSPPESRPDKPSAPSGDVKSKEKQPPPQGASPKADKPPEPR